MFTGIVEEVGRVVEVTREGDGGVLTVDASTVATDLTHGASIAVNGVCLTVTGWFASGENRRIRFDVMGETFDRTTVGTLGAGDPVDLERAVRADARLGGHVVQGHGHALGVDQRPELDALEVLQHDDGGGELVAAHRGQDRAPPAGRVLRDQGAFRAGHDDLAPPADGLGHLVDEAVVGVGHERPPLALGLGARAAVPVAAQS